MSKLFMLGAAAGRVWSLCVLPRCMASSKWFTAVLLCLGVVSAQKGDKACDRSFCLTVKVDYDRIICERRCSHPLFVVLRVRCNVDDEDRR